MIFINRKILLVLFVIFLLAVFLRFLYFPQNTYFGFDQARDAYAVKEILSGDLKIVGPPTANGVMRHGVLYYYIFAPFYFLSGGDPLAVSLFLRVINAAGIFLLFLIVYPLFGEIVALLAVFLFAISYEQTQFSLFLNHPSLAVISVLFFYLGLAYWFLQKKTFGFFIALFGLGLSIQFEFVEIQLIAIFMLFLVVFRDNLPKTYLKNIFIGLLIFMLPLSPYLISEVINQFTILRQMPVLLSNNSLPITAKWSNFLTVLNRSVFDNLMANNILVLVLGLILIFFFIKFFTKETKLIFLALWFGGGFSVYLFISNDAYFYNTGTSIALLIFTAFLLSKLFLKNKILVIPIILLILMSNLYLITKNNPRGPNIKINPQIGLLLKDEEKIIDFIYQEADGEKFAVNALTMPYNVNTTWSYLFEWYGQNKYGYLPVWGGDAASGFPGNLPVETARSKLPDKRFLIIEPLEGIPSYLADSFIKNEDQFAETVEKKQIGTLQVWVQRARKGLQ